MVGWGSNAAKWAVEENDYGGSDLEKRKKRILSKKRTGWEVMIKVIGLRLGWWLTQTTPQEMGNGYGKGWSAWRFVILGFYINRWGGVRSWKKKWHGIGWLMVAKDEALIYRTMFQLAMRRTLKNDGMKFKGGRELGSSERKVKSKFRGLPFPDGNGNWKWKGPSWDTFSRCFILVCFEARWSPCFGWKVGVAWERDGPVAVRMFGVFMGMYGAILSWYHLGGYVFSYVFCVCWHCYCSVSLFWSRAPTICLLYTSDAADE